jgi:hypothetical protein
MEMKEKLKSLKPAFGGVSFHLRATEDSRLEVTVEAKGSVDLPGDLDQVVAQIGGLLGLGNSKLPSESSVG